MAAHSSIPALKILWTEEAIIHEVAKESDTPEWLSTIANILFGTFACLFTGDTGLGLYFLLLYLSIFNIRVMLTS